MIQRRDRPAFDSPRRRAGPRGYAGAIPEAEFVLLTETGHMPQLETPKSLVPAVWGFTHARGQG